MAGVVCMRSSSNNPTPSVNRIDKVALSDLQFVLATAGLPHPRRSRSLGAVNTATPPFGAPSDDDPCSVVPVARMQLPPLVHGPLRELSTMNTSILWRDACAMSKALRKHLVASAAESSPEKPDSTALVRSLLPTPLSSQAPTHNSTPGWDYRAPNSTLRIVADGKPGPKNGMFLAQARKPKGFFKRTPPQVFVTEEGLLNQVAVYGCTGAGKTETLVTLALNAMHGGTRAFVEKGDSAYKARPRSVFYFDGKGDNTLFAKMFSGMSERGILGNLRVINLLIGGHSIHPDDRSRSHSIDLFDGFDEHALTQWLLEMRPTQVDPALWKQLDEASAKALAAVSRLAIACALERRQRIQPDLLLTLLTQAGAADTTQGLSASMGHLAKQFLALTWGPHANPAWRSTVDVMHEWLSPMVSMYAHVFNAEQPQISLANLDPTAGSPNAVLVIGRALEKCDPEYWVPEKAVLTALRLNLEKRPKKEGCDTVVILDDFNYVLSRQAIASLSCLRDRGTGIVWAAESLSPTPGFNEDEPMLGMEPATHVFMKQCLGRKKGETCYGWPYLEHQINTHTFLQHLRLIDIKDLHPGEAFIWDRTEVVKTEMDYANIRRQQVLFIPPAKPLPAPTYAFSGGALNLGDEQRQAQVLRKRLQEWEATSQDAPPLSWCQETVARMLGYANWHEAYQRLSKPNV